MYNLLLIKTNINDSSILRHPLQVIFQSTDIRDVNAQISRLISNDYSRDELLIMKDIDFNVDINVSTSEE